MKLSERSPYESGRDYAFRVIRENIILTELVPGSLVSEKELATELGLSRTPVREAIIDLSKMGIVEVLPQRGSRITHIDYKLVDEARFMRYTLESAVCKKLCAVADLELLKPLVDNVCLQEDALHMGDYQRFMELDDQFHKTLFELAEMPHAPSLPNGCTIHFDRVRSLSLSVVDNSKVLEDHRALIFSLLGRDPVKTEAMVEKHLSRYKIDEAAIREQYSSYFKPEGRR